MLRKFGGRDIGHDHRCIEYPVQIREPSLNLRLRCTDEDPIGVEEIPDRTSLTKELGVGCNVYVVTPEYHPQTGSGTNRHGRARNHDRPGSHHSRQVGDDCLDV